MSQTLSSMNVTPVIIIGAGRSGTNMLRDVLTQLDEVSTWPCDEINYIWRYGNRAYKTDEFTPDMASPKICEYIRFQFEKYAKKEFESTAKKNTSFRGILLEKTCANSLRIEFVQKVFPEARFIYIVRDGRDVVASASKRWKAPLDLRYIFQKARFIPKLDIPFYGLAYLKNRLLKLVSKQSTLKVWGPRFNEMNLLNSDTPVHEICSHQWAACVSSSESAFEKIDSSRVFRMRYEDLVKNPLKIICETIEFLDLDVDAKEVTKIVTSVSDNSIGKWKSDLEILNTDTLTILLPVLKTLGYRVEDIENSL